MWTRPKLLALSGFLLGVVIAVAIMTVLVVKGRAGAKKVASAVLGEQNEVVYEVPSAPPRDLKTLNILLLGYGGAGHQGGLLTDVIQVAHFDFVNEQLVFISIPRDLWVNLPAVQAGKINTALAMANGPEVAKQMAQIVTGLRIDYYISVDFIGFKRAVGYTLGGLEVDVPEALHDPWYPIEGKQLEPCGQTPEEIAELTATLSGFELEKHFACRYQVIDYPKGRNQMEGEDALNYVRSRHGSEGGDFSRSARQVALLKAIKNKLFTLEVFKKLPHFVAELSKHTNSDIDWKIVEYLAPALAKAQNFTVNNLVLSTDNVFVSDRSNAGQFILIPKKSWTEIHQFVTQEIEK